MPTYQYKVLDKTGKKIESKFDANSKNEVLAMLRENNYTPIEVIEYTSRKEINLTITPNKIKLKELAIFCRQFYTMINAGSNMINALSVLVQQSTSKVLKRALSEVHEDVQRGEALSDSMKKHGEIFPQLLVSMIEAGEMSGKLDVVLLRMAEHYEKENKINAKVKSAMIYPMVLGMASIGVVIFLLTFVMPTFIGLFEESGAELPQITQVVIGISEFMQNNVIFILMFIVALFFCYKIWVATKQGKYVMENLKLRLPVVGPTNNMIIVSRFTRTLATVLSSGITLIDSIDVVAKVVGYEIVSSKLLKAKERLLKGDELSKSVGDISIFPPMLVAMIKIGEESGSLDDILDKTANFYDAEVEEAIQKMTALMEPIMILIMGATIGFIVIAMMMPMFDMFSVIG